MQSVDQQIKDSDGIIVGHYLRSRSIKLEDGNIATQMIFKMNKEIGMQSELFGMDEIIVHYPGGSLGDEIVKVEGVPQFIIGEHVVLMIKNNNDRFWGMNLGFGTFKIINYGNEKIIVNTLFPNDRFVGQMRMDDFESSVRKIKRASFKIVMAPSYPTETLTDPAARMPASEIEGKNRAIASISEAEENVINQKEFTTVWLVLLLAMLGGVFRLTRQSRS